MTLRRGAMRCPTIPLSFGIEWHLRIGLTARGSRYDNKMQHACLSATQVGHRSEDEVRRGRAAHVRRAAACAAPCATTRRGVCDRLERSVQVRALDRWSDGSIRWALVDLRADLDGDQELILDVQHVNRARDSLEQTRDPFDHAERHQWPSRR